MEEGGRGVEEDPRLLVRTIGWMVLPSVGSQRTGKVRSCFGSAEFHTPGVGVNGDVQQAEERAVLEKRNWKFPVSRERERANYISISVDYVWSSGMLKPGAKSLFAEAMG